MMIRCALFAVFVSLAFSSSAEAQLFRRFSRSSSVQQYRSNYDAAAYQYRQPSSSVAYIPSQQRNQQQACGCQGQKQAAGQQTQLASNADSVLQGNQVQYVTYYDPYSRRYFQMPVATQNALASAKSGSTNQQKENAADAVASANGDGVKQAGFDSAPSSATNGYSVFQSASKIPSDAGAAKSETTLPYLELPPATPVENSGSSSVVEDGSLDIDLPALNPVGNGKQ